jgi:hypothetical protein
MTGIAIPISPDKIPIKEEGSGSLSSTSDINSDCMSEVDLNEAKNERDLAIQKDIAEH